MKKFNAAGVLVAAGAAVALVGLGTPAFASTSTVVRHLHPAIASHPLSAAANTCDGDHDSDDVNCGTSANKCDGDNDSDDVGCTTGSTSANKCDGDHDSDDWNCTGPSGHPMIPVWGHHHMFWHMHASSSHSWAMAEHHSSVASWLDRVKDSVLRLI
jgi:hypothetical protein